MLVDVLPLNDPKNTPQTSALLNVLSLGEYHPPIRLYKGIYKIKNFSFDIEMGWPQSLMSFEEHFPTISNKGEYTSCFGVCDGLENLLEVLGETLNNDPRKLVVSMTEIRRENQPPVGGWRWRKWGPYIGKHKPIYEYLYDEKDIDAVWCYHVYQVPSFVPAFLILA